MDTHALLGQEWQTLQHHHEQYERYALLLKLAGLFLALGGLAVGLPLPWPGLAVALCWLQEGILKTFQGRLGDRLLRVEALLRQAAPAGAAMQLHSEWAAGRPGGAGLIAATVASACRPTVAVPYLPLLLAGATARLASWL